MQKNKGKKDIPLHSDFYQRETCYCGTDMRVDIKKDW